jgi:hypothetical protein
MGTSRKPIGSLLNQPPIDRETVGQDAPKDHEPLLLLEHLHRLEVSYLSGHLSIGLDDEELAVWPKSLNRMS